MEVCGSFEEKSMMIAYADRKNGWDFYLNMKTSKIF